MYLLKFERRISLALTIVGFLMLALALISSDEGRIAFLVFGILFSLIGSPYLFYFFSDARKRQLQPDMLRDYLNLNALLEINGLQFTVIPFPDEFKVPASMVIAVLLQNAHSTPRLFRLKIKSGSLFGAKVKYEVEVGGGEVGVFNIHSTLPENTKPGTVAIRYKVKVKKCKGIGVRVIEREGMRYFQHFVSAQHEIFFDILSGKNLQTPPQNAILPRGYTIIYRKDMAEPDLSILQQLEQFAELQTQNGEKG